MREVQEKVPRSGAPWEKVGVNSLLGFSGHSP